MHERGDAEPRLALEPPLLAPQPCCTLRRFDRTGAVHPGVDARCRGASPHAGLPTPSAPQPSRPASARRARPDRPSTPRFGRASPRGSSAHAAHEPAAKLRAWPPRHPSQNHHFHFSRKTRHQAHVAPRRAAARIGARARSSLDRTGQSPRRSGARIAEEDQRRDHRQRGERQHLGGVHRVLGRERLHPERQGEGRLVVQEEQRQQVGCSSFRRRRECRS